MKKTSRNVRRTNKYTEVHKFKLFFRGFICWSACVFYLCFLFYYACCPASDPCCSSLPAMLRLACNSARLGARPKTSARICSMANVSVAVSSAVSVSFSCNCICICGCLLANYATAATTTRIRTRTRTRTYTHTHLHILCVPPARRLHKAC